MSDTPEILVVGSFNDEMIRQLETVCTVHTLPPEPARGTFLAARGRRITGVLTFGGNGLDDKVLAALPNLKVISSYGVGYDGIDAVAAAKRGILVSHTPGVLDDEVANSAILLWLATSRRFSALDAYVRAGKWASEGNPPLTRSPQNRTVGIVGLGRIGQTIADRLPVFGATVVYHARSKKDVPYTYYDNLTDMARACDVLICITPGGAATHHMINTGVLNALGPDGILVNIARGSVVDEPALIAALSEGRLGGAGLDVFEDEPNVPQALRDMENVTLQPHTGSATVETRRAMGDLTLANLMQFYTDGTVKTPVPECAHLNKT